MLIVGGGYVALEFANIFHGLGAETRIVHRGDRMLRGFDDDLRAHMHIETERAGIKLTMKTTLTKIEKSGERAARHAVDRRDASTPTRCCSPSAATPTPRGLGLERAGVKLDKYGAVVVDEYSQSSVDSIYAIGDVTNRMNLTPVAIRDGHAFADTIYNNRPTPVDHRNVPSAVFGRPPIGTVGLGEADARRSHGEVDVYRTNFRPMRNMLSGNQERTLMKLVVDREDRRVVRRAHRRRRRAGDGAARRGGGEGRAHQEAVGQHRGAASDRGRRTGADAREFRSVATEQSSARRSPRRRLAQVLSRARLQLFGARQLIERLRRSATLSPLANAFGVAGRGSRAAG